LKDPTLAAVQNGDELDDSNWERIESNELLDILQRVIDIVRQQQLGKN